LLWGCESWVLTDKVWKVLESFHNRAARRTTRKMPCEVGEMWIYPPLEEATEDAGVRTIQHHVEKRQSGVVMHVASRTICFHCVFTDANPTSAPAESCDGQRSCIHPIPPPSAPHTPPPGQVLQDLSLALRNDGAWPCWGRVGPGPGPAPMSGEVTHTASLATLWASPSGRGWFRTGFDA